MDERLHDTSGLVIKMIANAGDVADVDGNIYQTVKIGNQIWTVDNLRTTKYNDGTPIPLDTSTVTWDNAITDKFCYYNNIVNADTIKKWGALYNWYVVSPANPKKIAPTGWHVPSAEECEKMQNHLISNGYNWDGTTIDNKIAKSLAAKTDWYVPQDFRIGAIDSDLTLNNSSGFSALPSGYRYYLFYDDIKTSGFGFRGYFGSWWTTTEDSVSSPRAFGCTLGSFYVSFKSDFSEGKSGSFKCSGFSVRLLRD